MSEYKVIIKNTSRELTVKEKIAIKDVSDCIKLDDVVTDEAVMIKVDMWVDLLVHNDKAEEKEYNVRVVVDEDGQKYKTGSDSFIRAMDDIMDEIVEAKNAGENIGEWALKIYKLPSKNYSGKFLTCTLV